MSLRKAINDMCKQCIVDNLRGNGTWRQQTDNCTSKQCPLYPYRPRSTSVKCTGKDDQEDDE